MSLHWLIMRKTEIGDNSVMDLANMFSLCLTLKVILSRLKIILALKGPLKSFLDKINN